MPSVAAAIRAALLAGEPRDKVMAARAVARDWRHGRLSFAFEVEMPDAPGRPAKLELLSPGRMPKRGRGGTLAGRIALYHALAHIEFVAIDLALDMAGRFGATMSPAFVGDFLSVAADEAMHFALLDRRLAALGSHYGALPAHGGLWDTAYATRGDVSARLAVVPMVLEARGLDVTPITIVRLRAAGDEPGARLLQRILDDEIRHVRVGTKHFLEIANRLNENPETLWKTLIARHFRGRVSGPFNDSARESAGLPREFYAALAN
ncbi:MAG: ferritin-like domain-containing protein [Novosphingobium sp.]